jgi:ketosteroid isomerase-like protein
MSPDEIAVLDASAAFYRAFARRDFPALEALWARAAPVTCIHPGWDALRGREEVVESWRRILGGDPPAISATASSAHVAGDVAWVVCHERIPGGGPLVATNVFVREGGAWRLCHHQAGPLAGAPVERPPGAKA